VNVHINSEKKKLESPVVINSTRKTLRILMVFSTAG